MAEIKIPVEKLKDKFKVIFQEVKFKDKRVWKIGKKKELEDLSRMPNVPNKNFWKRKQ